MSAPQYSPWIFAAIGLHAAIFYGWGTLSRELPQFDLDGGGSLEVALVEAAGQAAASEPTLQTTADQAPSAAPEPTPPMPEPTPAPIPEPTPVTEEAPAQTPEPSLSQAAKPVPTTTPTTTEPTPRQHTSSMPTRRRESTSTTRAGSLSGDVPGGSAGPNSSALKPRRNPRPPYPVESRQAGEQGSVILMVSVNADGDVAAVRVQRSSGFPRLDEAARQTVEKRWKFQPARIGGIAIACEAPLTVRFVLPP